MHATIIIKRVKTRF